MGVLLWLIGIIFIIALAFWAAWRTTRLVQSGLAKFLVFIAALVFIFTGLIWAVMGKHWVAQREFQRLCAAEAGAKIYKSVQLPAQYFTEHGWVDFKYVRKPGVFNEHWVAGRYVSVTKDEEISQEYHINRYTVTYQDSQTGETLGVATTFRYLPAYWVPVPGHVSAKSCPQTSAENWYGKIANQIFLRSNEIHKE